MDTLTVWKIGTLDDDLNAAEVVDFADEATFLSYGFPVDLAFNVSFITLSLSPWSFDKFITLLEAITENIYLKLVSEEYAVINVKKYGSWRSSPLRPNNLTQRRWLWLSYAIFWFFILIIVDIIFWEGCMIWIFLHWIETPLWSFTCLLSYSLQASCSVQFLQIKWRVKTFTSCIRWS